jgi:indolepyruvate ferredoxin oxidoreductase, beta subunit
MTIKNTIHNVLVCGLGGQGVLKASEVLGVAAMKAGCHVKKSELHGMAQRGGSVESHVRFGAHVESPLIEPGTADYLLCFDAHEGERLRFYLREGGADLRPYLIRAEHELDDPRLLNTYLLAVLSLHLSIEEHIWLETLDQVLTRKREQNKEVFLKGRERGLVT